MRDFEKVPDDPPYADMPIFVKTRLRAVRPVVRIVDGLLSHNAFDTAASIAFWFFLSLIPLLVFAGFIFGQIIRLKGADALINPLLGIVPKGGAEAIVREELERMAGASNTPLGPLAILGFFWTASSGFHNLMDVFEIAARVPRRPWWKQRAIALVWVLTGLLVTAIAAWLILSVDGALSASEPLDPAVLESASGNGRKARILHVLYAPIRQKFLIFAMLAFGLCVLAGFYRFAVEHPEGVRRRAWPGALVAVGSWLLVSWGFGAYVVSLANYAIYYGSLAAVAVLLVWLYLTSLALVLGAEINCQLERVPRTRKDWLRQVFTRRRRRSDAAKKSVTSSDDLSSE